jgi:hypothetical protein
MGTTSHIPGRSGSQRYARELFANNMTSKVDIGNDDDVTLFASKAGFDSVPGLPKLDSRRIVRPFNLSKYQILSHT